MAERKAKGIGVLSGGLDSILAVKVLQEQDLDLIGITFVTPFFGPDPGLSVGPVTGIPVRAVDIGETYLEMLKDPRYGYGRNMNPCIDCHALMLREAGKIMEAEDADFLFTGEVVGQRPMSQRRDALKSVENLSGYASRVLRPLSAKLLPPTLVEERGLVDRDKLLDVHGRGRKRQMALAEHYGIKHYPQPGGGCLLTKEGFSQKLTELFAEHPDADVTEVELLKWGRLFRLTSGALYVIGRHRNDNEKLGSLARPSDVLIHVPKHRGPTGVMIAPTEDQLDEELLRAARIIVAYSDVPEGQPVEVKWQRKGRTGVVSAAKESKAGFEAYLL